MEHTRDLAAETALAAHFSACGLPHEVSVYHTIDSTNTALRARAAECAPGTVFLAHTQTAGKGSRGRSFSSLTGGLYFSVLLKDIPNPMQITCAAAVAVRDAIASVLGIETQIKWVNDLFLDGKKVCGILCEGITSGSDFIGAVLGIGINLSLPEGGFPPELQQIAGTLCKTPPRTEQTYALLTAILQNLYAFLADSTNAYMQRYRAHNLVYGRAVRYKTATAELLATVADICQDGSLLLVCENGTTLSANHGEVTLL